MNGVVTSTFAPTFTSISAISIPKHVHITNISEPRRSKRTRTKTNFSPDFVPFYIVDIGDVDEIIKEVICVYMLDEDPKTYEEVIRSIDSNFWKDTIKSKLHTIMNNHT